MVVVVVSFAGQGAAQWHQPQHTGAKEDLNTWLSVEIAEIEARLADRRDNRLQVPVCGRREVTNGGQWRPGQSGRVAEPAEPGDAAPALCAVRPAGARFRPRPDTHGKHHPVETRRRRVRRDDQAAPTSAARCAGRAGPAATAAATADPGVPDVPNQTCACQFIDIALVAGALSAAARRCPRASSRARPWFRRSTALQAKPWACA